MQLVRLTPADAARTDSMPETRGAVVHVAGPDDSSWLIAACEQAGAAVCVRVDVGSAFVDAVRMRGTARLFVDRDGAWWEQSCLATVVEHERDGSLVPVLLSALGPAVLVEAGSGPVPHT